MSEPTITSTWDFLFSWLLIGVERAERRFAAAQTPSGGPAVAVFSQEELARAAMSTDVFDIQVITARDLLQMMPADVAIVVDPGAEHPILIEPAQVVELGRLTEPFPEGVRADLGLWPDLPAHVGQEVAARIAEVAGAGRVWALSYTLADSPRLGCLVFEADGEESREAAGEAIVAALAAAEEAQAVEGLEVATVNIVPLTDLPDELVEALPDEALLTV